MALSSRMPDLESFEVFLAIAETGSLGSAARELGLTQQAVSRRLASMEAKARVTLAARTTRGSSLTSAGTIMAQWASRLLEVAHDIDAGLGSLREEGCQRIKVVASQTIAEHLMPHWLLSLRAANSQQTGSVPEVNLTATNSEHAIASVRGGAGPAAMSRLAVADDLAVGRLSGITVSHLDLRRELRAIWVGGRAPPAGAIRSFLTHISTRTKPVRR
jgi:DNA-binding transcriptional LysR family regulator